MNVILKFDVGDETKQGKVFSVDFSKDDKGPQIRYWLYGGTRFFSQDELEPLTASCPTCGRN